MTQTYEVQFWMELKSLPKTVVASIFVVPFQYIVEKRLKAAEHGGKVCCIVPRDIVLSCDGNRNNRTPDQTLGVNSMLKQPG